MYKTTDTLSTGGFEDRLGGFRVDGDSLAGAVQGVLGPGRRPPPRRAPLHRAQPLAPGWWSVPSCGRVRDCRSPAPARPGPRGEGGTEAVNAAMTEGDCAAIRESI